MIIHRHWFFFVRVSIVFFLSAIFPLFASALFLFITIPAPILSLVTTIGFAGLLLWWIVLWAAYAIAWTDYYLDTWTIGETAIEHIEQTGFFDRRITTWQLDSILDITVHKQGLISSLLNFGTLSIETAGIQEENESFEGVHNPEKVKQYILARVRDVQSLSETVHEKEEQLRSVSHDAKGHLTKSQATLASIIDGDYGEVPEKVKHIASQALSDARTGVDSMMHVLRPENTADSYDLCTVIESEVDMIRPLAEQKGVLITTEYEHVPVVAPRDAIARDCVRNLLMNALIYTPKGSVLVQLRKQDSSAFLSIADTGVGMSQEDIARLFTMGGTGTDSHLINPHSTGNGLFIAQTTARKYGGSIIASSPGKGQGSTFTLTLPSR